MKRPQLVVDAERRVVAAIESLKVLDASVRKMRLEQNQAINDLTAAQTEADADLPQCRVVSVSLRTGAPTGIGAMHVILRRTPAGTIFTRHVGATTDYEYKFKFGEMSGAYVESTRDRYPINRLELRDVPSEFMPKAPA